MYNRKCTRILNMYCLIYRALIYVKFSLKLYMYLGFMPIIGYWTMFILLIKIHIFFSGKYLHYTFTN